MFSENWAPLPPPEEFELTEDGLRKLERRWIEAAESGELGPIGAPVQHPPSPGSVDPDPQGDR